MSCRLWDEGWGTEGGSLRLGRVLDMSLEKPDDVDKALGPHSWHSVSLLYLHPEGPGHAQVISVARGMGLLGAVSRRSSEKVEKSPKHSPDCCWPEWSWARSLGWMGLSDCSCLSHSLEDER